MRQIIAAQTGAGSSSTIVLDRNGRPEISLQVVVSGTVNYTVQQSLDNPFASGGVVTWFDHPDSNLVAATANKQGNYAYVPSAVKVVVNSGAGTATLTVIQSGTHG
jgi:hypothetical protein